MSDVRLNLLALLEAIEKIEEYSAGFDNADDFFHDAKSFDATMMQFVVIGEMIQRLDTDYKAEHPEIPWQKIKDFRNIVAHDYFGIDAEEIWSIVRFHLLPLKSKVRELLKTL
jgi:uncharacterized protein with HEPN domain